MVPLVDIDSGDAVLGAARREGIFPGHLRVPEAALDGHVVVVGNTGCGKTTLLRRLALAEVARRRGLTIVLDCKGGPQARTDGQSWIADAVSVGADPLRCGVWPYTCHLNMWDMAADDLVETLYGMVRPSQPHYDILREVAVRMAVTGGPVPENSSEFLSRLSANWMKDAWPPRSRFGDQVQYLTNRAGSNPPALWDVQTKYANLFAEMAADLENGASLAELDALWCVVPGTRRAEAAKASANALVQMVVDALARDKSQERPITLIIDEYSAVSGSQDFLSPVVERLRSLGGRVVVAAQSWQGLGPEDNARRRLISACSGGLMLMRTSNPAPFAPFIGAEASTDVRHTNADMFEVNGPSSYSETWGFRELPIVDPQIIRRQQRGEVAYVLNGQVTRGLVEVWAATGSAHEALGYAATETYVPWSWRRAIRVNP